MRDCEYREGEKESERDVAMEFHYLVEFEERVNRERCSAADYI